MKLVFCSNYMNHHQLYLAKSLIEKGVDYKFIACESIEQERLDNGWEDMNSKYNFVVKLYENKEQEKEAKRLINNADLVISGSFPLSYLKKRIFSFKPVFLYNERLFKNSSGDMSEFLTFHNFCSNLLHRTYFNFFDVYMLCSSAYTAYDLSLYHNLKNKCYKWGYFPKIERYNIDELIKNKHDNDRIQILWVARFIDWKHPEDMVHLASQLKEAGFNFEINMIGVGPELENIKTKIQDQKLEGYINLLGAMSNEEVRHYMLKANIFVFTSDFNEGWGVVLNESMNSGCAVVASHAIGSVPYLIRHGENGYIYNIKNKDEIFQYVKELIIDSNLRDNFSRSAYYTIVNEWNPDNAAKKLLELYYNLINNTKKEIESGVCSKARVLSNFWIEEDNK